MIPNHFAGPHSLEQLLSLSSYSEHQEPISRCTCLPSQTFRDNIPRITCLPILIVICRLIIHLCVYSFLRL